MFLREFFQNMLFDHWETVDIFSVLKLLCSHVKQADMLYYFVWFFTQPKMDCVLWKLCKKKFFRGAGHEVIAKIPPVILWYWTIFGLFGCFWTCKDYLSMLKLIYKNNYMFKTANSLKKILKMKLFLIKNEEKWL